MPADPVVGRIVFHLRDDVMDQHQGLDRVDAQHAHRLFRRMDGGTDTEIGGIRKLQDLERQGRVARHDLGHLVERGL